jgi:hypothetical protein
MRIVNVVDAVQAQSTVQQRFMPPPSDSPPRRVQAINREAGPDDASAAGTAPPDDGISLALSPESREAARQAALEMLRQSQARHGHEGDGNAKAPDPAQHAEEGREGEKVRELEQQDRETRARGQAHAAAIGTLGGALTFTYQVGPDGRLYAVAGEVKIDTTAVSGDPEATLRKAQQIERAAFAPGDPSPEDRRAAAMAAALAARARQELARQSAESQEQNDKVQHVSENG